MRRRNSLYHLLGWTVFILYEMGLLLVFQPLHTTLPNFVYYPFYIIQFYVCIWLINIGLAHSKVRIAFILIGQWLLFAGIFLIVGAVVADVSIERALNKMDASRVIWRSGYFTILSATYWFIQQHLRDVNQQAQLQQKLLKSQNAYLRAQINPHLLFNTLNYIHDNLVENKEVAASSILLLSEVMQYAFVQNSEDSKAPLVLEIEELKRQLQLYELSHLSPSVTLDFDTSGIRNDHRIPSLLLLNFIENMFKHGDHTATYQVGLNYKDNRLYFSTRNGIRLSGRATGYHIGLQNAETRLSNLYAKEDYSLSYNQIENIFIVNLIIRL